jgi:hypothetical protein
MIIILITYLLTCKSLDKLFKSLLMWIAIKICRTYLHSYDIASRGWRLLNSHLSFVLHNKVIIGYFAFQSFHFERTR